MPQKTNNMILLAVLTLIIIIGSVYSVFAEQIVNAPYAIMDVTKIQKNGVFYKIKGIEPVENKNDNGIMWLADASDLNNRGNDFQLDGCKQVLFNAFSCDDLKFSNGKSVKQSVLERGYAKKVTNNIN